MKSPFFGISLLASGTKCSVSMWPSVTQSIVTICDIVVVYWCHLGTQWSCLQRSFESSFGAGCRWCVLATRSTIGCWSSHITSSGCPLWTAFLPRDACFHEAEFNHFCWFQCLLLSSSYGKCFVNSLLPNWIHRILEYIGLCHSDDYFCERAHLYWKVVVMKAFSIWLARMTINLHAGCLFSKLLWLGRVWKKKVKQLSLCNSWPLLLRWVKRMWHRMSLKLLLPFKERFASISLHIRNLGPR